MLADKVIRICYDAGSDAYFYNGLQFPEENWLSIGNGTGHVRRAQKVTTPPWCSEFTIPPTQATVFMKRTGTGAKLPHTDTQVVTIVIRKVSDDSILATGTVATHPNEISLVGEELTVTFDVTTEFSTEIPYYFSVEYEYGDTNNYLNIGESTQTGYTRSDYIVGWVDVSDSALLLDVHPGLAPHAAFGAVFNKRIITSGGEGNRGVINVGNLTYLDWSTPGGGGVFPIWDESVNSANVGGMAELYGTLAIFGTRNSPFLVQLTGTNPLDYVFKTSDSRVYVANHWMAQNTANDIWFGNNQGINALAGVQQYGDLRTFKESDSIANIVTFLDDDKLRSIYDPGEGLLIMFETGSQDAYVAHTKLPVVGEHGFTTYPWTHHKAPFILSGMGINESNPVLGGADGHLYQIRDILYQDLGADMELSITLPYKEFIFTTHDITNIQFQMRSRLGGQFLCNIFRDGLEDSPIIQFTYTLAISDILTVAEMIMEVDDANFTIDQEATVPWADLEFEARSFQVKLDNFILNGSPIFLDGVLFKTRRLQE